MQVVIRTTGKKQTKNERWKENHRRKKPDFVGKCALSSDLCIKDLGLCVKDLGINGLD